MPREIRSAPLRYGLALASFALILGASYVIEWVSPFRIDLTSLIIIAMIASAWYLGLGPGLGHLRFDRRFQPRIASQSKHVVHAMLFAPGHDVVAAEARVRVNRDGHLRPTLANLGNDPLELFARPLHARQL